MAGNSQGRAFAFLMLFALFILFLVGGRAIQNQHDEEQERKNNPTPTISVTP